MTRVLIVTHYYPPHVGGIERVAQTQAVQLERIGLDVDVATTAGGLRGRSEHVLPGLRVHWMPTVNAVERATRVPFPIVGLRALLILRELVRRSDVVHVHDLLYMTTWFAVVLAAVHRKPVVLTQHVHLIEHPSALVVRVQRAVYRVIGRRLLRRIGQVTYLNLTVREFLLGLGAAEDRLHFVPNVVDMEEFRPATDAAERAALRRRYGFAADDVLGVFVGRFVPKKGYHLVAQASGPGYTMVMVGGAREPVTEPGPVAWMGSLGARDVAALYRCCDFFVLPSVSEGFPLTVQEAMSSGLPIITTDDAGYDVYGLDRSRVALIAPQLDAVRTAVASVAFDPERMASMAAYSSRYAAENFSSERYVQRLLGLYATLLPATPLRADWSATSREQERS